MEHLVKRRRRVLAAALMPALLVPLLATAHAQASDAKIPDRICNYSWSDGRWQVKQLIKCAARRWDVPGGPSEALSVARCESRYDPDARNGTHLGVFQQASKYWPGRAKTYGFPGFSAFNGRANIIVSVRMAHRVGWGPWACA
jgi:hypothetical protein